ncbi:MAG: transglutaminase, partial [Pseudobutyrivibrio sp.]|nr:transglutaminase [Pseudobutyrivibrio sp.]
EVQVDSSKVNLNEPGVYTVIYTATDSMGNMDLKEGLVTVIQQEYTEEQVFALADEVLAEIITDDMSDYDKAHAIYVWVQGNIGYSESTDRGDWLKGAYDGLYNRRGDCYNYFAVSKALLTRAGIPNEDIEIIPTATRHHYWNVIDCGEGWRHFDTTPRHDKSFKGFYITDEDLMAYSDSHYHSHNYDRQIYTYFGTATEEQ